MLCTQCGAQVGATDEFCARCGVPLRGGGAPHAAAPADEAELVAAAIGRNTEYYLRRFEDFARGGSTSWNWPAFFVPLAWLLYRKMWLHGVLYFLAGPFVYAVPVAVLAVALGAPGALLGAGLVLAVRFVALPMFANALYYRVVKSRIEEAKRRSDRTRQLKFLDREGGTSSVAVIAVVLLVVPTFGVGILAAIAIPAYQDYTIRAQVSEGMQLAESARTAVADTIVSSGTVPSDLEAAGLPPDRIEGKYVDSVEVRDGRIDIRYGNDANVKLAGRLLSLTPYEVRAAGETSVAWRCGQGPVPAGATRALAEYRPGDLAVDWPVLVPSSCRSGGGVVE